MKKTVFCETCGCKIFGFPQAKKYRKLGYCPDCLVITKSTKNNDKKSKQCRGITKKGNRCKIPAIIDGYCGIHYKIANNRPLYKIGKPVKIKPNRVIIDDKTRGIWTGINYISVLSRLLAVFWEHNVEVQRYNYKEYLSSDIWKRKAGASKEIAGNRCQLCYSNGNVHAHHRTYERVGHEYPTDITVLCADCHAKFHEKIRDF